MKTLKEIRADCGFIYDEILLFHHSDYSTAFIGLSLDNRAVYDWDLMIDYLMKEEKWTSEEAIEWIDFNTIRSFACYPNGPIVMKRIKE